MIKIRCVVEHITYQNAENGYSIMKVNVKGYNDLVTIVGSLLDVPVGSVLLCEGDWKVDKKYGSQFVIQSYEEVMPATIYGIEKYLGSGLVKGIGPKFAKLIAGKFGLETIDVIESDIERLYEVSGIGKKRVELIRESWEKQKDIKNVMLFLQGYGVSTAYAAFDRHTFGDMDPWVYKTTDHGQTWTRIASAAVGVRGYAHVVKEDVVNPNILFLGTEMGLFITVDGGARWVAWPTGKRRRSCRAGRSFGRVASAGWSAMKK